MSLEQLNPLLQALSMVNCKQELTSRMKQKAPHPPSPRIRTLPEHYTWTHQPRKRQSLGWPRSLPWGCLWSLGFAHGMSARRVALAREYLAKVPNNMSHFLS